MNQQKLRKIRARQIWIKTYKELGSVTKAARKCGIPRSTLYRWISRYEMNGTEGLKDRSQRPNSFAKLKLTPSLEKLILKLRGEKKWGPKSISTFLLREKNIELSAPTIWRVLNRHKVKPLKRYRGKREPQRYSRPIPGDRVQIDVTKVKRGVYQFTAIDDCTRMKVLRLFPNKTSESAVTFLYSVLDDLPFPVQRVQTDCGTEFFNDQFQEELAAHFIKYRPNRPGAPHLNGKVERTQKTDKEEFYSTLNLNNSKLDLKKKLAEWQHFYNHRRPHSSLGGKTPWEAYLMQQAKAPIQPDVTESYWNKPEPIRVRNSAWDRWRKENQKTSQIS